MKKDSFEKSLRNDNVYVTSEVKPLAEVTTLPFRKGLDAVVISEGVVVNVVSSSYGHLPNEDFFAAAEAAIIDAGLKYETRSINRENRSFAVDYVLNDDRYVIKVKGKAVDKNQARVGDVIKPMLRFVNSYDGMSKASGSFGFYRLVCTNGLMVANQVVGFKVLHKGMIAEVALPQIAPLIQKFMSNEYYELSKKFEVLAERPIKDLNLWVKGVADQTKLFGYEISEKNPLPSLNARLVLDTITREAALLGVQPNAWLGYNAFNEVLHDKLKKGFDKQKALDANLFNSVLEFDESTMIGLN